LIIRVSGELCALPHDAVQEVLAMAELVRSPGRVSSLEGFLNLRGSAVPVLNLWRLFDMPPAAPSLYTPLIVLRRASAALVADSVEALVPVPAAAFMTVAQNRAFNDCLVAELSLCGRAIHVLSADRLLLQQERRSVEEMQAKAQRYIDGLEGVPA
jgi:purine-binding chemotaxis protein CheW